MRVVLDGRERRGRAIDLAGNQIAATALSRAIRRSSAVAAAAGSADDRRSTPRRLRVDCAAPGVAHDHVGVIAPTTEINVRAALADAARSWGETAPQRDQLQRVERRLAAIEVPDGETRAARRAVAAADADEQRLRESVAELRGRVQTLRDTAPDSQQLAEAEADLEDAVRALSEAETERLAAEQRLARAERAARRARDARERRLRLQDRAANLRREARSTLARRAYPAFREAVADLPGTDERPQPDAVPEELPEGDASEPTAAALAIARIAAVDAPIVLATLPFSSVTAAATWLDAPVVAVA